MARRPRGRTRALSLARAGIAALMLSGCEYPMDIPADADLANPLFPESTLIEVGSPDLCSPNLRPTLTWVVTHQELVHAAIFRATPVVSGGRILNTGDAVWRWHTGLPAQPGGSGREGNVLFRDGEVVPGDGIAPDGTSLVAGRPYLWAVWAWNSAGTRVIGSSRVLFFVPDSVGSATCAPRSLRVLRGRWASLRGDSIGSARVGEAVRLQVCLLGYFTRVAGVLRFGPGARVTSAAAPARRRGPVLDGCSPNWDPLASADVVEGADAVGFSSAGPDAGDEPYTLLLEAELRLSAAGSLRPQLGRLDLETAQGTVHNIVLDFPALTVSGPGG